MGWGHAQWDSDTGVLWLLVGWETIINCCSQSSFAMLINNYLGESTLIEIGLTVELEKLSKSKNKNPALSSPPRLCSLAKLRPGVREINPPFTLDTVISPGCWLYICRSFFYKAIVIALTSQRNF